MVTTNLTFSCGTNRKKGENLVSIFDEKYFEETFFYRDLWAEQVWDAIIETKTSS
jgi:hypothetical protein